MYVGTMWL